MSASTITPPSPFAALAEFIRAEVAACLKEHGAISERRVDDAGAVALGVAGTVKSLQAMLTRNRKDQAAGRPLTFNLPPHGGEGPWRTWSPAEIVAWQASLPAQGVPSRTKSKRAAA